MAVTQRTRAQVIRSFLPGQTFEHANETAVRVLWTPVSGAEVHKELLLEALDAKLAEWVIRDNGQPVNRAAGFLQPVADHADEYAVVEPDGPMFYKTWPLTLYCTNPSCGRVETFQDEAAWRKAKNPERCNLCNRRRRQFEYIMVHTCGRDRPIPVPPCKMKDASGKEHGWRHIFLHDTGSFETASWRCRYGSCNQGDLGRRVQGMRQVGCNCGEPGPFRYVTLRQDIRFITHTLKLVTFEPAPMVELRDKPGSRSVVLGSYLEFFGTNWQQALNDASKDRSDSERKWLKVKAMMEAAGDSPEELVDMRKAIMGESGGAFDEIVDLVGDDVVAAVGAMQRARERTLIWGEAAGLSVWRLDKFEQAATQSGRPGAVQVIKDSRRKLREFGFSNLLVLDNFPVAYAAYGYTRINRSPEGALLKPFPILKAGGAKAKGRTPIYCATTNTEAVFFELSAERVIAWLSCNGKLNAPLPQLPPTTDPLTRRRAAKAFMLQRMHADQDIRALTFELQHTLAHVLIKNLGERSGFGEDTMSEYLMPETLTIGLFADLQQNLSLGALVALVEHRLGEWLDAAAEGGDHCQWDPHCSEQDGACMSCLHLAFSCDHHNDDLDRGLLFGTPDGHEPQIDVGYWEQVPALP